MATPLLWLALLCASLTFATSAGGVHLKLTHVDAKENCTVEERVRRATERTHRRLASMGGVAAPVHWALGLYIAEYLVGDPPQPAEAIVDTGSNLVWTQCSRCSPGCFDQNLPLYDPTASRTASAVPCNGTACAAALGFETHCSGDGGWCAVDASYGGGDISGLLGTETFTFGSEKVGLAFGCIVGTGIASGSFAGASGIMGLGRGALSLPSQLGDAKFSYCFTPYFNDDTVSTSHLFVGASAGLIAGSPVTAVPFVKSPTDEPFNSLYYLPLAGITVGDVKLAVPATAFDLRQVSPGMWAGTFIDSGSPFTSLAGVVYQALRAELARQLGSSLVQPPAGMMLDLCVALADADRLVPPLVLHFGGGGGGADVMVPPVNYWAAVDEATVCMVVLSSAGLDDTLPMNETTVIGNFMTQNMHLLYDLGNGVLSFQPADCSSF